MRGKCLACHTEVDGVFSRISDQRKTPEGWLMTIARMQIMHGLKITDEERRTVVKYLADRQGLAPSETDGYRYAQKATHHVRKICSSRRGSRPSR